MTNLVYVTPAYFEALQIPLRTGRLLAVSDTSASQYVAVVNAAFAKRYLGRENGVGRHLLSDGNTIEVVGITANVVTPPGFTAGGQSSRNPLSMCCDTDDDTAGQPRARLVFSPVGSFVLKGKSQG